jgi:uncharacterized Zn finger protein
MPVISAEMRDFARKVFADDAEQKPCQDCGGVHTRVCPRLSSVRVVVSDKGVITEREVTYWAPGTWEKDIIWAEDVYDDDEPGAGN